MDKLINQSWSLSRLFSLLFVGTFTVGCASVEYVEITRDQLNSYSCDQLESEMVAVGAIGDDAQQEQGVTGANVTSATFVPFGLQINQKRAESAERKAEVALSLLYEVWDDKGCAQKIYERNKEKESSSS